MATTKDRKSTSPIRRKTQAAALQDRIELAIVRGEFTPGEHLDEHSLADRFGVSRTPVREALKGLSVAKLVQIRPHAGVFVASPPLDEIIEMFELMTNFEAFAASLAAERATQDDIERLRRLHDDCGEAAKSEDAEAFFARNQEFHRCIYELAKNSVLLEQIEALDKRLAPYRRLVTFRPGRVARSIDEHKKIFDAIEQGKSRDAFQKMSRHLSILADDAMVLARATSTA